MHQPEALQKVLVVEDEFFLADDIAIALRQIGVTVVGPVPTPPEALSLLDSEPGIDAALLDINLRGQAVYDVAEALRERRIPFLFATGYDVVAIPDSFRDVVRVEKPFATAQLINALRQLGPSATDK